MEAKRIWRALVAYTGDRGWQTTRRRRPSRQALARGDELSAAVDDEPRPLVVVREVAERIFVRLWCLTVFWTH